MNVHVGHGCFDRAQDVAVIERRQSVRQAALDADFSRAHRPGFDRLLRHGFEAVEVAVVFARAAAEGAELAADKTNVGEIDIAIDHVGDEIADQIAAQHVGRDQQAEKIVAFGIRQKQALFAGEHAAILRRHDLIERVARFRRHALGDRPTIRAREKSSSSESGRTRVTAPPLKATASAKQIIRGRANQVTGAAPAGTISESSNDTRRRTS